MPVVFIPAPSFPPSALPPSQRVRLLVRHLHEFGWLPVIFTVDQRYREDTPDPWMVEIAGRDFEKIEVHCLDQRKTRKLGIGDLGLRMFTGLFFSLLRECRKRKPSMVLYPVPPWYIMVMAPVIKWLTGVPYAIDFIDPWIFDVTNGNRKAKISQWLARRLEGFAVKRSCAIFAVSEGILNDLVKRYPGISKKPLVAVPYGVERSDFEAVKVQAHQNDKIVIRYTGAVSRAMLPVADSLFKALKKVNEVVPVSMVFTGTSYAGAGLVKPVLEELIAKNNVAAIVSEHPARVGYREALELGMSADMQLLMGDTTPYYAASKMMGLVASGKPFFALVHGESFPANFLRELGYPYAETFDNNELGSEALSDRVAAALQRLAGEKDRYKPIEKDNPVLARFTATAMTETFVKTFETIEHE